jgi:hypothetical protein
MTMHTAGKRERKTVNDNPERIIDYGEHTYYTIARYYNPESDDLWLHPREFSAEDAAKVADADNKEWSPPTPYFAVKVTKTTKVEIV